MATTPDAESAARWVVRRASNDLPTVFKEELVPLIVEGYVDPINEIREARGENLFVAEQGKRALVVSAPDGRRAVFHLPDGRSSMLFVSTPDENREYVYEWEEDGEHYRFKLATSSRFEVTRRLRVGLARIARDAMEPLLFGSADG